MSPSGFEGQGRDARDCLLAGVAAADAEKLTREALARLGGAFPAPARGPGCGPSPGPPSESTASSPILMAGFGKAALEMGRAAAAFFGGRIERGLLLIPHGSARGRSDGTPAARSAPPTLGPTIHIIEGGHPLPDTAGVAGAHAVHELALAAARTGIPLLCLVSGGGSALLTLPPEGVSLDDLRDLTRRLLHAGAGIAEVNCVRRHLDRLKGGRLALQAAPAPVIGLLLSDVIGDSPAAIASGPLSPDSTTFADAVEVLERHGLWKTAPQGVRHHLARGVARAPDTPREVVAPDLSHVRTILVGNARTAADAVVQAARLRGYRARLLTVELAGEAREAGQRLGRLARRLQEARRGTLALVAAGETVVTVRGSGRGGRNQELVLAAALEIDGCANITIASLDSDGIDGSTPVAGALAAGDSVRRARGAGLDPAGLLAENDSYRFFEALGGHIDTGPTGTNVMDLHIALIGPA